MPTFTEFGLRPQLLRALEKLRFTEPTPIQSAAIPPAMEGRDILASAATGSGKTVAFALPILHRQLEQERGTNTALILAPTRELVVQIAAHINALAAGTGTRVITVYGGVGFGAQASAFRRGADVIVATPGRLLDHLTQKTISLEKVTALVFDEVDRMLDMGFLPVVRKILKYVPTKRQTLFFSATIAPPIATLSKDMLVDPVRVDLTPKMSPALGITQSMYSIDQNRKTDLLIDILKDGRIFRVLAFTRTKSRANRLADTLEKNNIPTERIHGNRSQAQRTRALAGFKSGKCRVLVATDIAARGIDIVDLDMVVNYDVPMVPEDYVHRIGRTGRAQATGDAVMFVANDEQPQLRQIERALGMRLDKAELPELPPPSAANHMPATIFRGSAGRAPRRMPRRERS